MNAAELLIEREDDRVNYLCEPAEYGSGIAHGVVLDKASTYRFEASVIRFLDERRAPHVVLSLKAGAFGFQDSISPADARLLARALNLAADEAEAAAQAREGVV